MKNQTKRCIRSMIVTILIIAIASCSLYADVPREDCVTRGDFFVAVAKGLELEPEELDYQKFPDYDNSNGYINALISRGWILGCTNGLIELDREISREEMGWFLERLIWPKEEILVEHNTHEYVPVPIVTTEVVEVVKTEVIEVPRPEIVEVVKTEIVEVVKPEIVTVVEKEIVRVTETNIVEKLVTQTNIVEKLVTQTDIVEVTPAALLSTPSDIDPSQCKNFHLYKFNSTKGIYECVHCHAELKMVPSLTKSAIGITEDEVSVEGLPEGFTSSSGIVVHLGQLKLIDVQEYLAPDENGKLKITDWDPDYWDGDLVTYHAIAYNGKYVDRRNNKCEIISMDGLFSRFSARTGELPIYSGYYNVDPDGKVNAVIILKQITSYDFEDSFNYLE